MASTSRWGRWRLAITLPDIAASTTARVDLDVSVNDDAAPGTITNTAIIRPPTLGPISRHVSHTITVNPDLENTNTYKYGSGSRVLKPGDLMTYYVYVYNDGTDTARDARVKEFLPPQVTYVPGSLRIQGVDQNEKELPDPILLGDIGRNVSRYMYFTVRVHDFAAPGPIVNRAVITAQGGLTVVRHATNDISARAVLNSTSTYKYASPQGTLKRGDCFYYYVYVKNSGTAWARGVEVRDFLPAKVTYVAGSLIVDGQDQHEKTLPSVIKFPDIGPGSTKYMYFRVCVNSDAAQGLLRNTARISAFGVEPMVRTFTHTVSVKADLDNLNTYKYPVDVVSRTDTNTLRSGDIVEYRIWLYNNGSDTATGIT